MSDPLPPTSVKLLVGFILRDTSLFTPVFQEYAHAYGNIDFMSTFIPFTTTTYYQAEMGAPLLRRFITFEKLIDPGMLPQVKRWTHELESKYKDSEGKRMVNGDPGYLSLNHLILATHKKHSHRPYLRDGIYADLTLLYQRKSFHPLPWTYPDYGSAQIIDIMNRVREHYKMQLREECEASA